MAGEHPICTKANVESRGIQCRSVWGTRKLPIREHESNRLNSSSYAKLSHIRQILLRRIIQVLQRIMSFCERSDSTGIRVSNGNLQTFDDSGYLRPLSVLVK